MACCYKFTLIKIYENAITLALHGKGDVIRAVQVGGSTLLGEWMACLRPDRRVQTVVLIVDGRAAQCGAEW